MYRGERFERAPEERDEAPMREEPADRRNRRLQSPLRCVVLRQFAGLPCESAQLRIIRCGRLVRWLAARVLWHARSVTQAAKLLQGS